MSLRYLKGNIMKASLFIGVFSLFALAEAGEYQSGYSNDQHTNDQYDHHYPDQSYDSQYANNCSSVKDSCCGTPCNEAPAYGWAYNPPAYAECGCNSGNEGFWSNISGRVDFLWWRASEEGLELGKEEFVDTFVGTSVPERDTVINVSRSKKPDFKYDPGFRIGLLSRCACDSYDVALNWTHFHSKANTRGTSTDLISFFSNWERIAGASPAEAKARYTLNLDLLDLEIGRKFYVSNCFAIRPNIGLRGARIDQNYRVAAMSSGSAEFSPLTSFTSRVKSRSDFLAIGPRVGVDLEVHVGCGLILFGQAAGSVVFGTSDNHSKERFHDNLTGDSPFLGELIYEAKNSSNRTSRTFTDFAIGLKWEHCYEFCNNLHPVSLAFAWEHHGFYKMNDFNFAKNGVIETVDEGGGTTTVVGSPSSGKSGDLYTQGLTVSLSFGF